MKRLLFGTIPTSKMGSALTLYTKSARDSKQKAGALGSPGLIIARLARIGLEVKTNQLLVGT